MVSVSVVTGGAGGMGLAAASLLGSGGIVVVADLDLGRLEAAVGHLAELGVEAHPVACDVTDRSAVGELVDAATSLGEVTSVVHTAGISPSMGSPERILAVNVLGTVNVAAAFGPLARPGFALVNVASSAGHLPAGFPVPRRAYRRAAADPRSALRAMLGRCRIVPERLRPGIAYAISKNFVIWYTRHLAGRFGERGARTVSVSPGSFDTDMGRREADSGAGELALRSALGRYGRVEEIAEVLAFCAGDGAGYLTGVDILVDGGAKATMTARDMLAMARGSAPSRSSRSVRSTDVGRESSSPRPPTGR